MALKLMYITNRPEIAEIVSNSGVDRVFIDLETIGKEERQGNMDTVKSKHEISDIPKVKSAMSKTCELIVRTNPIYPESEAEIDAVIKGGADIVMLPYYKTLEEVKKFISFVNGRARVMVLAETKEAKDIMDEVVALDGVDEVHIGLNDMHLSLGLKFMFQLLADGTVEKLGEKIKCAKKGFGFGGIAKLGAGAIPAEMIIAEHYRIGSETAILSRSFCNTDLVTDLDEVKEIFDKGVNEIRAYEKSLETKDSEFFEENRLNFVKAVDEIVALKQ